MAFFPSLWACCQCLSCCNLLSKCSGGDSHKSRLLGYLLIFYVYYGISILAFYTFAQYFMSIFSKWIDCKYSGGEDSCLSAQLVFRIGFSLCCFYVLLCLLMLPRDNFSFQVNKNLWMLKWLFPLILFIIFCFFDGGFFNGWAKFCRYGSIAYLLFQDLTYNEFFFRWSNLWKVRAKSNCCYYIMFILVAVFCGLLTLYLLAMSYVYNFNCGWTIFFQIYNTLLLIVYVFLTIIKTRNDVNWVTTTVYSLYTTYYFYSAFGSDTVQGCSKLERSSSWVLGEILIRLFLLSCILIFMTFTREVPLIFNLRPLRPEDFQNMEAKNTEVNMQAQAVLGGGKDAEEALDVLEYSTFKYVWMFLLYALVTIYFLAVITNWGTVLSFKDVWVYQADRGPYIIKLVNALLCSLIYLWVLVAPIALKNRQFGYPEEKTGNSPSYNTVQPAQPTQGGATEKRYEPVSNTNTVPRTLIPTTPAALNNPQPPPPVTPSPAPPITTPLPPLQTSAANPHYPPLPQTSPVNPNYPAPARQSLGPLPPLPA